MASQYEYPDALFLFGSGFNADAKAAAGSITGATGKTEIECGYPLVADLGRLCFDIDELPTHCSVEDLFQEAEASGNREPMEHLAKALLPIRVTQP